MITHGWRYSSLDFKVEMKLRKVKAAKNLETPKKDK